MYRKYFGLSHKQLMEEPFEVYVTNIKIMEAQAKYEGNKSHEQEQRQKAEEWKRKHGN